MKAVDVVVVGGGVIGCSIAYYTAKKGYSVALIERGDIASGTSGSCDGGIAIHLKKPGIHLKLALESVKLYPELEKELDDDIHLEHTGSTMAFTNEDEEKIVKDLAQRQAKEGLNVCVVSSESARDVEPLLSPNIKGALHCSSAKHVHPQSLCLALFRGAKKLGVKTLLGTEVVDIKTKFGSVESVFTDNGDEIICKFVINACGVWAPFLGRMLNIDIPITPRRGQLIVSEPVPKMIFGGINSARYITSKFLSGSAPSDEYGKLGLGLSMEQTKSNNLLIGGTREFVGYDRRTTHLAFIEILKHAVEIVPQLKDIHIIRSFAGLRPYTTDSLPILGEVQNLKGFVIAAGHEGDGICLAPITGKIISALISGEDMYEEIDISKLSPSRFVENATIPDHSESITLKEGFSKKMNSF